MTDATDRANALNDNQIPTSDEWHGLLAQLDAIELLKPEETTDEDFERCGELAGQLLALPSPDGRALIWKLRYLLEGKSEAAPALEDARRILGVL
jgi:hypothetical protein